MLNRGGALCRCGPASAWRALSFQPSKLKFVDKVRIRVRAGNGGNGCNAFESLGPTKRRPAGGHGGRGGDVTIVASKDVQSLALESHHFNAGHGQNGSGSGRHGRAGASREVRVPRGTVVKEVTRPFAFEDSAEQWEPLALRLGLIDAAEGVRVNGEADAGIEIEDHDPALSLAEFRSQFQTEYDLGEESTDAAEEEEELHVVADLDGDGAELVIACGGKGGVGNSVLKGRARDRHGQREQPLHKRQGQAGEERFFELELKTIAHVGLVGYPNAGKSTFLSAISRASPRVAAYPFTTLHPSVGHVYFEDDFVLTIADIPGLIEGAHRNVGLGHDFLRHIERTPVLLYVVDTAGTEGRAAEEDLASLQYELGQYDSELLERPSLVLANKMDLAENESAIHGPDDAGDSDTGTEVHEGTMAVHERLSQLRASTTMPVLPASALHDRDLDVVLQALRMMVEQDMAQDENESTR